MNDQTLLLRQIHPSFLDAGRPSSAAFRPTPKDDRRLSTDDGDRISPEAAHRRFLEVPGRRSSGVMAVQVGECTALGLEVDPDGDPHPEHVSVVFAGLSHRDVERRSKQLRAHAVERGWLHGDGGAA